MKIFETKSSLKVFYYLLAVDGRIDDEEENYFRNIGVTIDPRYFPGYVNAISDECYKALERVDTERFSLIVASIDEALAHDAKLDDQGITPRLLVWNLFAAAFSNGVYDESEKRLITYVADKAGVDESVVLEMEQSMKTLAAIQNEIIWANDSDRPYAEIKSIVNELEKRQRVIRESAEYLIADEIDADNPYEYKPDFFDKTKAKIDEKLQPVSSKIGEVVKPVSDKVSPVTSKIGAGAKKTADAASQKIAPVAAKAKEKSGEMFGKFAKRLNCDNRGGN